MIRTVRRSALRKHHLSEEPPERKEDWVDFARFDLHGWFESSLNFLSAIFGIFGKFSIDIGENYFRKHFFFETKKFSRKKSEKFSDFFWKFWFLLKNHNLKIWNFRNFRNFEIFKILIFLSIFFIDFPIKKCSIENIFYFFREKVLISKKYFQKNIFENNFHLYRC